MGGMTGTYICPGLHLISPLKQRLICLLDLLLTDLLDSNFASGLFLVFSPVILVVEHGKHLLFLSAPDFLPSPPSPCFFKKK